MNYKIVVCYEIVTPESAEYGDAEETGVDDEIEYDEDDDDDGNETPVIWAVEYLSDKCLDTSSSHFDPGDWYIDADADIDYSTGAEIRRSYHLHGFSDKEQMEIYQKLFGKERP